MSKPAGPNPRDMCSVCGGMRDPPSYSSTFGCESCWHSRCDCDKPNFGVEGAEAFIRLRNSVEYLTKESERLHSNMRLIENQVSAKSNLDKIAGALEQVYNRFTEIEKDVRELRGELGLKNYEGG